MAYVVGETDDVTIVFGSGSNEFEFTFAVEALAALGRLCAEALGSIGYPDGNEHPIRQP
jgi:hypothetical protein